MHLGKMPKVLGQWHLTIQAQGTVSVKVCCQRVMTLFANSIEHLTKIVWHAYICSLYVEYLPKTDLVVLICINHDVFIVESSLHTGPTLNRGE